MLKEWFAATGYPVSLADAAIPDADIGNIAEHASALAKLWRLKNYTEEVIAEGFSLCS